jgi:hypothetical protein
MRFSTPLIALFLVAGLLKGAGAATVHAAGSQDACGDSVEGQ